MLHIDIIDTDGLRLLQFGTAWTQGAMQLDAPDKLVLQYAERMFAWLLFHDLDSLADKHLVTLGLGAGSLTKFAHNVLGMRTTAVEIDADVIAAARKHFLLPADSERLQVLHADGRDFIEKAPPASIDVLQVDAYDADVDAPALDSERFYAACRAALRPGGTVCINLVGQALDVSGSVGRIRAHLRPQAVWQFPPADGGNVIVVAHCGDVPDEDALARRAEVIEERWLLPAKAWLAMARRTRGTA
jgi:spermidine synthase